jgi:hypothetical protein
MPEAIQLLHSRKVSQDKCYFVAPLNKRGYQRSETPQVPKMPSEFPYTNNV